MTTLQNALLRSNHPSMIRFTKEKERREEENRRRSNILHAKSMRDKAIMEIHKLAYSRKAKDGYGGMLVPRRAADREKLAKAMQKAAVYASLARPENGYPEPPFRRDPEYPAGPIAKDGLDSNNFVVERNRLVFWLQVLKGRNAPQQVIQNVEAHIVRLATRINRGYTNDIIRRKPGTREFTLRPAPRTTMKVMVEYK